jgi:hypothetical protein
LIVYCFTKLVSVNRNDIALNYFEEFIYFLFLDKKKVSKKNQEIAKAIAIDCDRQTKAKMSPGLRYFLTLLFVFAAPISF